MIKRILPLLFLILILPLITSCESKRIIVNKLSEREANEIIVFLGNKGVDATKTASAEAGGAGQKEQLWDITVPSTQYMEALSYLNQAGLPKKRSESLLDIFKESGLVPSEMTETIRYQAGLAEEIASRIRKFDGILDADVIISFPKEDPLNPGKTKGEITASVYVKHNGVLDDPNSHLNTRIKRLVESSVTGLKYDNISVIADRGRYADTPFSLKRVDEEKELVSVWSVLVAKESLTRFRLIFFSFILLILLLLLTFFWIGWKIYPLMQRYGGFSGLMKLKPLKPGEEGGEKTAEEDGGEQEEEKKEDEEEGVT